MAQYSRNSLKYLNTFKFIEYGPQEASNEGAWNHPWKLYVLTEMLNTALSSMSQVSSYLILKLGLMLNTLVDHLDISCVSLVSKRVVESISRILIQTDYNVIALFYSNLLLKFTSSQSFFTNKYFDNCFFDWMDRLISMRPEPLCPDQSLFRRFLSNARRRY